MAAGSIVIDLLLKTGSFSTDAQRSAKDLEKLKRSAVASGQALVGSLRSIAAAAGVGLSIAGLVGLVKGSIDAADRLNDLSQKTGIAVETLGGIGFAAGQAGGDLESAAAAAGKLNKTLAEAAAGNKEAAEAFKVLGIAVKDSAGNTKKADEIMAEVADRFAEFEDGPEKAALALRLFGKAGADIIPLLNEGGQALRSNIAYYQRFGGVTTEVARQADEFNDVMGKIGLLSGSFTRTLTAELLPTLKAIADRFLEAKESGDGFKGAAQGLSTVFDGLVIGGKGFLTLIGSIAREMGALAAQTAALWNLLRAAPKDVPEAFRVLVNIGGERRKAAKQEAEDFIGFTSKITSPANDAALRRQEDRGFAPIVAKRQAPRLTGEPTAGGADQELKKRLDAQLKEIRQFDDAQRQALDFANAATQEAYQQGLTSLADYFAAQKRIRDVGTEGQIEAANREIAALTAYQAKLKPGPEQIDAQTRIAEAIARKSSVAQKAANDDALGALRERQAISDLADTYGDLRARVLELAGDTAGAAAIRNTKTIADARKLITSAGGDETVVSQYTELLTRTTQLTEVQRSYNALLDEARTREELILEAAKAGGATELDTLRNVGAARQESLGQMAGLVEKSRELADALKTPEAIAFANQLAVAFAKASNEVDPLLAKVKEIGKEAGDAIAQGFEAALISGNSLRDVLKGIERDLLRIVTRETITKPLSEYLGGLLGGGGTGGGGTGGGGGIFGKLFGGRGASSATTADAAGVGIDAGSRGFSQAKDSQAANAAAAVVESTIAQTAAVAGSSSSMALLTTAATAAAQALSSLASSAIASGSGSGGSAGGGLLGLFGGLFGGSSNAFGGAASAGFGSGAGFGNLDLGAFFHSGGIAGQAQDIRPVPAGAFDKAQRLNGIAGSAGSVKGLAQFEIPAIVLGGPKGTREEVLKADDPRHSDKMGRSMLARFFHSGGVVGGAPGFSGLRDDEFASMGDRRGYTAPAGSTSTARGDRSTAINIVQNFAPGTTRATTDQAAASAAAAARKAVARIR